jgi:hypothetical protein
MHFCLLHAYHLEIFHKIWHFRYSSFAPHNKQILSNRNQAQIFQQKSAKWLWYQPCYLFFFVKKNSRLHLLLILKGQDFTNRSEGQVPVATVQVNGSFYLML